MGGMAWDLRVEGAKGRRWGRSLRAGDCNLEARELEGSGGHKFVSMSSSDLGGEGALEGGGRRQAENLGPGRTRLSI